MTDDTAAIDEFPFPGPREGDGWEWPKDLTPAEASAFLHDAQTAITGLDPERQKEWLDDIGCPVCQGKFTSCGHCPNALMPKFPDPEPAAAEKEPAEPEPVAAEQPGLDAQGWDAFLSFVHEATAGMSPDEAQAYLMATHCPRCDGNLAVCGHFPQLPPGLPQQQQLGYPPGSGYPIQQPPFVAFPARTFEDFYQQYPHVQPPYAQPQYPPGPGPHPPEPVYAQQYPSPPPYVPPGPCAGCYTKDHEITQLKAELYDRDKEIRRLAGIVSQTGFGHA